MIVSTIICDSLLSRHSVLALTPEYISIMECSGAMPAGNHDSITVMILTQNEHFCILCVGSVTEGANYVRCDFFR